MLEKLYVYRSSFLEASFYSGAMKRQADVSPTQHPPHQSWYSASERSISTYMGQPQSMHDRLLEPDLEPTCRQVLRAAKSGRCGIAGPLRRQAVVCPTRALSAPGFTFYPKWPGCDCADIEGTLGMTGSEGVGNVVPHGRGPSALWHWHQSCSCRESTCRAI